MKFKLLFFLCFSSLFCACDKHSEKSSKPILLVSLPPHKTLVQKIAKDAFIVETVVPLEANPHVFEPTPRQLSQISQSTIWFQIGESFEKKISPVLQQKNPNLTFVDLRKNISTLLGSGCSCHHHAEHNAEILEDKHIWTSPRLLKIQAETITSSLREQFPENSDLFTANLEIVLKELDDLDEEVKENLSQTKNRSILVSHPAFAYFCKDYKLEQLSIEHEGKEPTVKHINEILQKVQESHTKVAIGMPQHSNKGLEIISQRLNLSVCQIDPYDVDYEKTIRTLSQKVSE